MIRFGNFYFTARAIRNAIHRDRIALSAGVVFPPLPCGVRQLARLERWLEAVGGARESDVDVPTGPAASELGIGPTVSKWFARMIREAKYCKGYCASCGCNYPKSRIVSRTRRWPGIRIRGHGPTGAGWEKCRCCPRGHEMFGLGYKIS